MIVTETQDEILTLVLARGKGNSLNTEFLRAIADALEEARRASPRGLILTAQGKTFCAGLDLQFALAQERAGMRELLEALFAVGRALFEFPRPVVAALNGHTIAGGAVLSLCCDVRLMSGGEGKWGLSEIALGLSVPGWAVEVARYALPRPVVERVLYSGRIYPEYKAYDMGVLDLLPDESALLSIAREMIVTFTPSVHAFADIKRRLHAPTMEAMVAARDSEEAWLDLWFSSAAQSRISAALSRLRGKRAEA